MGGIRGKQFFSGIIARVLHPQGNEQLLFDELVERLAGDAFNDFADQQHSEVAVGILHARGGGQRNLVDLLQHLLLAFVVQE